MVNPVYWRHPTPVGIKVEEITFEDNSPEKLRMEVARQVYCENGRNGYREIGHFPSGFPFLHEGTGRISIAHCPDMFVVATLPDTPECDLSCYSDRAALGVDVERADRQQVLRIRDRFLSEDEAALCAPDDVTANVLLWTVKEAAYKAALSPGLDFRKDIRIHRAGKLSSPVPAPSKADRKNLPEDVFGEVSVTVSINCSEDSRCESVGSKQVGTDLGSEMIALSFKTYSYMSEGCIVTLCFSPRCAKFGADTEL